VPYFESENRKPHKTSIGRKVPIVRGLSATRLLPIAYTTKRSILSLLTFHRGKQASYVRVSIMQLSFIELLHVSAQPLHKVKILIQKPREGYAFGACLPQRM
jgi:hypothetical protein